MPSYIETVQFLQRYRNYCPTSHNTDMSLRRTLFAFLVLHPIAWVRCTVFDLDLFLLHTNKTSSARIFSISRKSQRFYYIHTVNVFIFYSPVSTVSSIAVCKVSFYVLNSSHLQNPYRYTHLQGLQMHSPPSTPTNTTLLLFFVRYFASEEINLEHRSPPIVKSTSRSPTSPSLSALP